MEVETTGCALREPLPDTDTEMHSMQETMSNLEDLLSIEIQGRDCSDEEKEQMLEKLQFFCSTKTNIILVGATGSGKSSTINALFSCGEQSVRHQSSNLKEVAKVGITPAPETSKIEKYTIGNLTLWDTPGLGDSAEQDEQSKEAIQELLEEMDEDGNRLIDLVLVVLDASSKDLGTTYNVLNNIIIPNMDDTDRILVALNQSDIAMKHGRHWDYKNNCPDETLQEYLEEKVQSIQARINEDSGVDVTPIYYCAGCKDAEDVVVYPYNMAKLLYYIVSAVPAAKRVPIFEGLNDSQEVFRRNDGGMNYGKQVAESFFDTLSDMMSDGLETGSMIGGEVLGIPGKIVGGAVGGIAGAIGGCVAGIYNFFERLLTD